MIRSRRNRGHFLTEPAREVLRNMGWVALGLTVLALAARAVEAMPFLMGVYR